MTLLLAFAIFAAPEPIVEEVRDATVARVIDGDTVDLKAPGRNLRVRLAEVDSPEAGQTYHAEARTALWSVLFGSKIRLVVTKKSDRYGRVVGHLYVTWAGRERWVNEELVKAGGAWWANDYSNDHRLARAQALAWEERKGLWKAEDRPTPPWRYRKRE